jgi:hypothetical protein
MQAISNDPTTDNCSAPGHAPDAVHEGDDDIIENREDQNIGGSREWNPKSDDSDCEVFSCTSFGDCLVQQHSVFQCSSANILYFPTLSMCL